MPPHDIAFNCPSPIVLEFNSCISEDCCVIDVCTVSWHSLNFTRSTDEGGLQHAPLTTFAVAPRGDRGERDFTISVTMTKEYDYQESKKSSLCVCFQILLAGDNMFYSFMFTPVFHPGPGLLYHRIRRAKGQPLLRYCLVPVTLLKPAKHDDGHFDSAICSA